MPEIYSNNNSIKKLDSLICVTRSTCPGYHRASSYGDMCGAVKVRQPFNQWINMKQGYSSSLTLNLTLDLEVSQNGPASSLK